MSDSTVYNIRELRDIVFHYGKKISQKSQVNVIEKDQQGE